MWRGSYVETACVKTLKKAVLRVDLCGRKTWKMQDILVTEIRSIQRVLCQWVLIFICHGFRNKYTISRGH